MEPVSTTIATVTAVLGFIDTANKAFNTLKTAQGNARKARANDDLMSMIKVMIALIGVIVAVTVAFGEKIKESIKG